MAGSKERDEDGVVVPLGKSDATSSAQFGARHSKAPRRRGGRPRADQALTPEDIQIVEAYIELGSKAAVARRLGISASKVSAHLGFSLVKEELARRIEELRHVYRARLQDLGDRAFRSLEELLVNPNPHVRLRAAIYVIDRLLAEPDAGAKPPPVPGIDDRLAELRQRLEEEDDA
jgi:DNA-binding CsgD family transcriptional regulator